MSISLSSFNRHINAINQLHPELACWNFRDGMSFADKSKWWGEGGERPTPHEGLDLIFFEDIYGACRQVDLGMLFPPLFAGEVVAVFDDFLGESILLRHRDIIEKGATLYTIYGHTRPLAGVVPGRFIEDGTPMARVSQVDDTSTVAAHLHLSLCSILPGHEDDACDWRTISGSRHITLLDPYPFIKGNHE